MAERWKYNERNHPPYCTCVNCARRRNTDRSRPPPVGATTEYLEHLRAEAENAQVLSQQIRRREKTHRNRRIRWSILAVSLLSLIVAYLVLTVTAPDAVEELMEVWTHLFDNALARAPRNNT